MTDSLNSDFPDCAGHAILIEQAANAHAAIDVLKSKIPGMIPMPANGGKLVRAHAVSPQIEGGNVFLPGAAAATGLGVDRATTPAWVQDFVEEAATFPYGAYDDQVDAMGYALSYLARRRPQLRVLTSR